MPPRHPISVIAAAALTALCPLNADAQDAQGPLAETWTWLVAQPQRAPAASERMTLGPAQSAFDALLDARLDTPPAPGDDRIVEAALAVRVGLQLVGVPQEERGAIVEHLAANPGLAAEVAFLLGPSDDHPAAYAVLGRLIQAHGRRVAELAPLAAAICAVHDRPLTRRVNENTVTGIDPVALFGYFEANERALHFSPRETSPTLLLHVADATGTLEELEWARRRYGRDKNIGNRYQEISYDTRAATQNNVEKRVTAGGEYTLQAIRQHGGVCADQAYFAMTVGKAVGVPACYVRGRGGDSSHAWIGFLEQSGRRSSRWNFSEGRYESFEDVQGKVVDPQTGVTVPDAFLTIQAVSDALGPEARHRSMALTDGAARLSFAAWQSGGEQALTADLTARQLGMLRDAIRADPGNLRAWELARDLLCSPTTPPELMHEWTQAIDQMAGAQAPDFAIEILAPIFDAQADPASRFRLWEWAAGRFRSRPDLAARARFEQARALEAQGKKPGAAEAFHAVFEQFPEAGPISVEALAESGRLLEELGRTAERVEMYERAWRKLRQPRQKAGVFLRQTSWYRVGRRYADLLEAAGDDRAAGVVRRRLDP